MPYISLAMVEISTATRPRVAPRTRHARTNRIDARCRTAPAWPDRCGYGGWSATLLVRASVAIQMGKTGPTIAWTTCARFVVLLAAASRAGPTAATDAGLQGVGFTNRYLPADVVDALAGSARRGPDSDKPLKRLNRHRSGYAFLYFCDSRVGICDPALPHGTTARHTSCATTSSWAQRLGLPWAEKVDPPYAGLTMDADLRPDRVHQLRINGLGTPHSHEPDQLLTAVTEPRGGAPPRRRDRALPPQAWGEITRRSVVAILELSQQPRDMGRTGPHLFLRGADVLLGPASVRRGGRGLETSDWSSPRTASRCTGPARRRHYAGTISATAVVR